MRYGDILVMATRVSAAGAPLASTSFRHSAIASIVYITAVTATQRHTDASFYSDYFPMALPGEHAAVPASMPSAASIFHTSLI